MRSPGKDYDTIPTPPYGSPSGEYAVETGVHLVIDGYVRDPKVFKEAILSVLIHELVGALGLTIVHGPVFAKARASELTGDLGSLQGFALLTTSHIAVHCWPLQRFFSLDVYARQSFDTDRARMIIDDTLDVMTSHVTVLNRNRSVTPPMSTIPA